MKYSIPSAISFFIYRKIYYSFFAFLPCVQSIEKLDKAGDTVRVAPGYFRNHLMPKLFAVPNIDKFAYPIREQRKVPFLPFDSNLCLMLGTL